MAKINMTPTRAEIARKAKAKREKLGLSMREAAKLLCISASTYSRVESGKPMRLETYCVVVGWVNEE